MPDNTATNAGTGGDTIATDELVTLNGAAVTGVVKAQRVKVGFGVDGVLRDVDSANPLPVFLPSGGFPSVLNFTEAQLAPNAVFTGTAEDVSMYANVKITVFSSHVSAINGLQIQQSHNGTVWYSPTPDSYTIPAGALKIFSISPSLRFLRIIYTNGPTLTTQFLISPLYHVNDKQPSSVRPQDGRENDNDFVEVLSSLMGYNSLTDAWNRLGITNAITAGNENLFDRLKVNASLRVIDSAQPSGSKLVGLTGSAALGLDVNLKSVGITSANLGGNETLLDRLKVNASIRMIDITQPVGSQLVGATGTQALGLTVNIVDRATRLLGVLSAGANTIGAVNINGTVPVSGPLTDTQIRATPLPISGTVVTGGITDTQIRATPLAISGTVVTGGITDTQIRATPLAVSGPFFQTTQPVSLAINTPDVIDRAARLLGVASIKGLALAVQTTPFAAAAVGSTTGYDVSTAANVTFIIANTVDATAWTGNPIIVFEQSHNNISWALLGVVRNDTNLSASTHTLPTNAANTEYMFDAALEGVNFVRARVTTGTTTGGMTIVVQPGSMPFSPVVTAILNPETTKVIGTVNLAAAQTLAAVTAITNQLPTGANKIGTIDIATAPATIKGTQGANFLPTQDAKDAGRNQVHYYTLIPVLTSATDTLQSLTGTKGGVTVTATTTPAVVTTGKTFRVTRVAATYIATAVSGYGIVRLRFNTAGVVTISSPVAATLCVGSGSPVTVNATGSEEATLDEGHEFSAATGVGISVQGFAAATATAVGYVLVSVTGYEY